MTRRTAYLAALLLMITAWACNPDDDNNDANNGDTADAVSDSVDDDASESDASDAADDAQEDASDDADDASDTSDSSDADASEDADSGFSDGSCRSAQDCEETSASCVPPGGFAGCGACTTPERTCTDRSDCSGGDVCRPAAPEDCLCDDDVSICAPPCTTNDDCDAGETCTVSGMCIPLSCDGPGSACPTHFTCQLSTCDRQSCTTANDCPDGVCVNGRCYGELGTCTLPAP